MRELQYQNKTFPKYQSFKQGKHSINWYKNISYQKKFTLKQTGFVAQKVVKCKHRSTSQRTSCLVPFLPATKRHNLLSTDYNFNILIKR